MKTKQCQYYELAFSSETSCEKTLTTDTQLLEPRNLLGYVYLWSQYSFMIVGLFWLDLLLD